jgi:hypothetical protein
MELAAIAGCDGHHFLNGSLLHFSDNAAACGTLRAQGRSKVCGASLMLEYQVNSAWTATSARWIEPSHRGQAQVLSEQF